MLRNAEQTLLEVTDQKVLLKVGVLKNFGKSTGKTSFLSLPLLLKILS